MLAAGMTGHPAAAFASIIAPLIRPARARLREEVSALMRAGLPLDAANIDTVAQPALFARILPMVARTLVLELHASGHQGELEGNTPEDRFRAYVRRMSDPRVARSVFREYPVLVRQLAIAMDQWVTTTIELVARLGADWPEIRSQFEIEDRTAVITEMRANAGDRHRQGRSVHILTFASGFRLVYKPRSLAVDRHFQELLAWLNARGDHPPFRTLRVLDHSDYGWAEFVSPSPCVSEEGVRRFYRRQGASLALLHALHATDFHYENVIAAGEHPVLVDLEPLFHQTPLRQSRGGSSVSRLIGDSVLRVGLLPYRFASDVDQVQGIEISGLGGAAGQLTPQPVGAWEGGETDAMRFVRARLELPVQVNRPAWNDRDLNASDYAEDIVAGFESMYRLLVRHREELSSDSGPLAQFAHDPTRCILRPTQMYATLLSESFHPQLLRDALSRERFFDHLWVGVRADAALRRFIAHECEDLQRGDVPVFTTLPGSRDLWASTGTVIPDAFESCGLDRARERIRDMSDADLSRQTWFVRSSLTALMVGEADGSRNSNGARVVGTSPTTPAPSGSSPHPSEVGSSRDKDALERAAREVGDRLCDLVLVDADGEADWIGLSLVADRYWTLTPTGLDLYSGLPGIGLFLAYLGAVTGEDRYTELARRVARTVRRRCRELSYAESRSIGAFQPLCGSAYFLIHAASLWDDPTDRAEIEPILDTLQTRIEEDRHFDVISGAAGCIATMMVCSAHGGSSRALELARRCGEHLLAHAARLPSGWAWRSPIESDGPLTGFSHGAAGIGWALARLAEWTGQERFRTAAQSAIDYERGLYSSEAENWPDLRRFSDRSGEPRAYPTAWCHGAPGIALSRLPLLSRDPDPELRREVEVALSTTLARGFGRNHSLCHGDLGNLDVAAQAADALEDSDARAEVVRLAMWVTNDINRRGRLCGTPAPVETPGLMVGLAGIGYGLLRLLSPTRVPSVLSLAPPLDREVAVAARRTHL